MAYEKRTWLFPYKVCVNKCPTCEQEFVILVMLGGDVVEQVGETIYCYMCGKRFNENINNNKTG